jgi:hypothetical protein
MKLHDILLNILLTCCSKQVNTLSRQFLLTNLLIRYFYSLFPSRGMMGAGHVARMGENRKVYKVLVGKPEGKRPLGRPRRRWEDQYGS